MQEDTPEERQSDQLEGLTEKVVSLEKENDELKAVPEMETKTSPKHKPSWQLLSVVPLWKTRS